MNLSIDLKPYFTLYEALAGKVDEAFKRISGAHPDLVACRPGCTDCCYALFDLTLIEAIYLNHHFNATFTGPEREVRIGKANRADRDIYRLKKAAFHASREGKNEQEVVEDMARKRVRCPLLNEKERCDLYPHRPLACRIYGVPLSIGEAGRTCGLSGFTPGQSYPTVSMDTIHEQLIRLSSEFVQEIGSNFANLADILVPVSMVLLTDYDRQYLGLPAPASGTESEPKEKSSADE